MRTLPRSDEICAKVGDRLLDIRLYGYEERQEISLKLCPNPVVAAFPN